MDKNTLNLHLCNDELNKAGLPVMVPDFDNGFLGLLLGSDWRLCWDWDASKIDEEEWAEEPTDVLITVHADGTVLFTESDDENMIFPSRQVDSPKQVVDLLTRVTAALSKEMSSRQAIDQLNSIFSPQ